ncbi:serine-threonine kinase [Baekduia alba]|uniref:serine/threonine protein kinase n=1 Tax=Baekduia alba TaxID=2997333 RepID=UPI002341FC16|nr:hypothetical protein [Baekduia alba]WCB96249.1 serine-threonine kinase [Baekduia alba]
MDISKDMDNAVVDGFAVARVVAERDGWTVAEASKEGRKVQLHVSSPAVARDAAAVARIERLDALRAAPRKPGDLALSLPIAAGRDGDRLYVARPRIAAGTTLADRLAEGPMERDEAVRILSLVAGALDTLAALGLPAAHLTPGRIALTPRKPTQPLLYDYGFPTHGAEAIVDVADYVAPEVAGGAPLTTAGNVYALACVLVECLTGAPPFPYDRPLLVLDAHRREPPPRVAEATGLPPELDDVLQSALNKRPEHRQQSAAGLLRAVQRSLGRRRVPIPVLAAPPVKTPKTSPRATAATSPPATASPRATSPPRRHRTRRKVRWPVPSGVGVAAVLLLATTAGYATATSDPRPAVVAPAPLGPAAASVADPNASERAALLSAVDRAIDRLDRDRATAREDLRAARHTRAQAAAAARLAAVYRDARRALPPTAALAAAAPARALDPALASVQRAYHRLATTARAGDAAAFRSAARGIVQREATLDATLRQLTREA